MRLRERREAWSWLLLDEQESEHEDHAEHVGEREPRLQPEQRRQRHDEGGAQGDRPIGVPPLQDVEHRSDGGPGQGRNERERARVIGNDAINELSRRDIDGVARRMRPMLGDIEVVEAEGEVHRVPIVEPMRPRDRRRARRGRGRGKLPSTHLVPTTIGRRNGGGSQPLGSESVRVEQAIDIAMPIVGVVGEQPVGRRASFRRNLDQCRKMLALVIAGACRQRRGAATPSRRWRRPRARHRRRCHRETAS